MSVLILVPRPLLTKLANVTETILRVTDTKSVPAGTLVMERDVTCEVREAGAHRRNQSRAFHVREL